MRFDIAGACIDSRAKGRAKKCSYIGGGGCFWKGTGSVRYAVETKKCKPIKMQEIDGWCVALCHTPGCVAMQALTH